MLKTEILKKMRIIRKIDYTHTHKPYMYVYIHIYPLESRKIHITIDCNVTE